MDRVGKKSIALWFKKKKWRDSWVLVFSPAKWSYYALLKFKSDIRGQIVFNDADHVTSTQMPHEWKNKIVGEHYLSII